MLSLISHHLQVMKQGSLVHEDASLKLLREFRNEVERWQWRGVAFSNDDEHVIGASNAKNEHIMYVWNAVVGNLERILEGKHDKLPTGVLVLLEIAVFSTVLMLSEQIVPVALLLWKQSLPQVH